MDALVEGFARGLAKRWSREAELLDRRGLREAARLVRSLADDVQAEAARFLDEALTLEEAAASSGYSYSALQHMVRSGTLPDAGEKGRPRIRRGDIPRRPALKAREGARTARDGASTPSPHGQVGDDLIASEIRFLEENADPG